jgi:hypothetical protein
MASFGVAYLMAERFWNLEELLATIDGKFFKRLN